jgi:hypothetical protein
MITTCKNAMQKRNAKTHCKNALQKRNAKTQCKSATFSIHYSDMSFVVALRLVYTMPKIALS